MCNRLMPLHFFLKNLFQTICDPGSGGANIRVAVAPTWSPLGGATGLQPYVFTGLSHTRSFDLEMGFDEFWKAEQ